MDRTIIYTIPQEYHGEKISVFLWSKRYSKQNIAQLKWTTNSILLDGSPANMNQKLECGQILTVQMQEQKRSDQIIPREIPFPIIYEDEDLIVVNKPAGMPSQPSWYYEETSLASAAAFYWKRKGWTFVYRCINRLDKDTSGLIILAKNAISGAILNAMHDTGELRRTYYAIVEGMDLLERGTIRLPIGKDESTANRYQIDEIDGKHAVTHYQKLREQNGMTLVNVWLETGRTHQIRVHMSAIGHPLVGDATYNTRQCQELQRQALHAGKLEFPHPITGEHMKFQVELPEDMRRIQIPVPHIQKV